MSNTRVCSEEKGIKKGANAIRGEQLGKKKPLQGRRAAGGLFPMYHGHSRQKHMSHVHGPDMKKAAAKNVILC